ncbi:MAG TPA: hypothetical protein VGF91_09100 [Solirubrobacteraceae bacterium]
MRIGRHGPAALEQMPTLVRDPQPAEFEALLERRRRLRQDLSTRCGRVFCI